MIKEIISNRGPLIEDRPIPTDFSGRVRPSFVPLDPWAPTIENRLLRRNEREASQSELDWLVQELKLYKPLLLIEKSFSRPFTRLPYKFGKFTCANNSAPFEGFFSGWQGTLRFYPEMEMGPGKALNPCRILAVWPSARNNSLGKGILQAGEIKGFWAEFSSWISGLEVITHTGFKISNPNSGRYSQPFEAKIVWDRRKKQPKLLIYKQGQNGSYGFSRPDDEEKERLTLKVVEDKVQATTTTAFKEVPNLVLPPILIKCLEKV